MARIEDLKEVLKETLENKGVLNQVRARIRAEVFNALDDHNEVKPTLSNENFLINELIREYLDFNKYNYTKSVLTVESGQPPERIDRRFLLQQLNMEETRDSLKLPILYGMLSKFMQNSKHDEKVATAKKQRKFSSDNPDRYPREIPSSHSSILEEMADEKRETLITYKN